MDNKVSIHATLAGGDGEHSVVIPDADKFLSTPPSRVATYRLYLAGWAVHVSIHATLAGGDLSFAVIVGASTMFLSTPPSRVATCGKGEDRGMKRVFLSTPPSRVATRLPRACPPCSRCFYPRHPRGWRPVNAAGRAVVGVFLSTPPSRVATVWTPMRGSAYRRFYPRHPRGWRPGRSWRSYSHSCVSIHATLAGGDRRWRCPRSSAGRFLSTPPSRVATIWSFFFMVSSLRFYPRHPRGWRHLLRPGAFVCG